MLSFLNNTFPEMHEPEAIGEAQSLWEKLTLAGRVGIRYNRIEVLGLRIHHPDF